MKQVLFKNHTDGKWYITNERNYNSYIQNARQIHCIEDLKDPQEVITRMCEWYGDTEDRYIVIY